MVSGLCQEGFFLLRCHDLVELGGQSFPHLLLVRQGLPLLVHGVQHHQSRDKGVGEGYLDVLHQGGW